MLIRVLFFFLLFMQSWQISAQAYYSIQLNAKSPNSYALSSPQSFLSETAIQRKSRFNIPIDSLDLPVSTILKDSILTITNGQLVTYSNWHNILVVDMNAADTAQLQNQDFVSSWKFIGKTEVTEMYFLQKFNNLGINDYPSNYHPYKQIEGLYLHSKGFFGEGIRIAVFDNGFAGTDTLEAFEAAINQTFFTRNLVNPTATVYESGQHGTNVWSIIAAKSNDYQGIAQQSDFALFVTEDTNREHPLEMYYWARAAEVADSLGIDIINSSLGYFEFENSTFDLNKNPELSFPIISSAARIAHLKGIVVVNSAGNEGNKDWKYHLYPANEPSVFSVGSSNSIERAANFSSYGYPNGEIKPNVIAQGRGIQVINSDGSITPTIGTSFASPIITGFTSCLWEAYPNWSANMLKSQIEASAHLYNNPTNHEGYGIPNFKSIYLEYSNEKDSSKVISEPIKVSANRSGIVFQSNQEFTLQSIKLYSLSGQIVHEDEFSGNNSTYFHSSYSTNIVSGIYICELTQNQKVSKVKVFLE